MRGSALCSGGGSRGALPCTISCVTIRNFLSRTNLGAFVTLHGTFRATKRTHRDSPGSDNIGLPGLLSRGTALCDAKLLADDFDCHLTRERRCHARKQHRRSQILSTKRTAVSRHSSCPRASVRSSRVSRLPELAAVASYRRSGECGPCRNRRADERHALHSRADSTRGRESGGPCSHGAPPPFGSSFHSHSTLTEHCLPGSTAPGRHQIAEGGAARARQGFDGLYQLPRRAVRPCLASNSRPSEPFLVADTFADTFADRSHDLAAEKNHKTISAAHVLDAVKQLGWDDGGELHRQLKKDLAGAAHGLKTLSLPRLSLRRWEDSDADGIVSTGFRAANEAKKKGVAPPAPPPKAPKPTVSAPVAADPASNEVAAAVAEASTSAAAGEGGDEAATPVLRNERANADEADLYPGGEDLEEDDLEGVEEYVDEGEDDEMEDAGSEGIDDEEVADRGLEDDQDENDGNYREGQA